MYMHMEKDREEAIYLIGILVCIGHEGPLAKKKKVHDYFVHHYMTWVPPSMFYPWTQFRATLVQNYHY